MRADLLRCFLGHFYRWIKSVLKLFFMGVYQHAVEGMQYVIVVPASWSHAQTSIMKRLLMCSDFRGSIDDTSFVLDSEAILWSNTALPLTPSGEGRAWRKRLNPFEVAVVVNADEDSGSIKSFRRIGDTFQARPFLHGEYFPLENLESSSETAFDETFTSLQHMVACSVKCEDDERPEHDITGGLILMERFKTLAAEKFIATGLFRDLDCMPKKRLTCEIDVSEISKRNFYISMEQLQGDITAWVLSLAEMVRDHIIGISESKAAVLFTDVSIIHRRERLALADLRRFNTF